MKLILSIIFLASIAVNANAKKLAYPIEVVAAMADVIVVGEIERANSKSYRFKIEESIKGGETGTIKVHMFREWVCDTRIEKVKKGQRLLLFLIKEVDRYEIINDSTGEVFIRKSKALVSVDNQRPPIDELVQTLKDFAKAYVLKNKEHVPGQNTFIQLISNEELDQLAKASKLNQWFFDQAKAHSVKE